ncbi:MAG: class I SAM-dependent methyltransferase [Reichenbachiella sp.]|uniref:class I SAM-dependent methyltransferase n=1 Tax=Reichenbachiella sp. TaxID=2184521 RepID=UPI003267C7F2
MSKNSFELNEFRGPLNSWMFKTLDGYMDYLFVRTKRDLFKNHPDTVVEIGPGTGANMRYLRKGSTLIAIEPNIHMHKNLRQSALDHGINLEIKSLIGEAIDMASDSCEFVIGTLVLCTVDDPRLCLEQIKRILKQGGEFVFIEHVKARSGTLLAFIQRLIHRPWHWFFEGCHTNRDTSALIRSIGFSEVHLDAYALYSPFVPIIPQIKGRAIK